MNLIVKELKNMCVKNKKQRHSCRSMSQFTSSITGSGITLTNNDINSIKVIKSLENRGILLKRTTRKITSKEGGFLNFLRPLMTAGIPLMRSVLAPLAKSVLLPFGLSVAISVKDASVQKNINGSGTTALIISKKKWKI